MKPNQNRRGEEGYVFNCLSVSRTRTFVSAHSLSPSLIRWYEYRNYCDVEREVETSSVCTHRVGPCSRVSRLRLNACITRHVVAYTFVRRRFRDKPDCKRHNDRGNECGCEGVSWRVATSLELLSDFEVRQSTLYPSANEHELVIGQKSEELPLRPPGLNLRFVPTHLLAHLLFPNVREYERIESERDRE